MKQIRNRVFETNSSSMHSVTICNGIFDCGYNYALEINDGKVIGHFDEFGWGYDEYNDVYNKLNYLLTMIACNSESIDDFYESEDFKKLENCLIDNINCDGIYIPEDEYQCYPMRDDNTDMYFDICGYIDHQSMYESIFDFLDDNNLTLETFLFDSNVILVIDNDNH